MTATIQRTDNGFRLTLPEKLFQTQLTYFSVDARYEITRDGQKFLMVQPREQVSDPHLTVVINWLAAIKKNGRR